MSEKQEIIKHDADIWDYRAAVMDYMTAVDLVHRALGGESDAAALAITVADQLELWDDYELPWWVNDAAETAVERADEILTQYPLKDLEILEMVLKYKLEAKR